MATTRIRVPPGGGGLRQPVRGVIGGAAFHLPQQALAAGQVKEAGVPPVGEQHVLPGVLIQPPPGPAAAVLVDAQVRHRAGGCSSSGSAAAANASCATGQDMPLPRAASAGVMPALRDLRRGLLPQPPGQPAPRRHLRHPLGERLPPALPGFTFPAPLHPPHLHRIQAPGHIPRPGQHLLMDPARHSAAVRARASGRMIGDRPYLHRAARPGLRIGDLQALHAEQHGRRILEHDARGFLMILKSVGRPKIVGAAGSLIRAPRR